MSQIRAVINKDSYLSRKWVSEGKRTCGYLGVPFVYGFGVFKSGVINEKHLIDKLVASGIITLSITGNPLPSSPQPDSDIIVEKLDSELLTAEDTVSELKTEIKKVKKVTVNTKQEPVIQKIGSR